MEVKRLVSFPFSLTAGDFCTKGEIRVLYYSYLAEKSYSDILFTLRTKSLQISCLVYLSLFFFGQLSHTHLMKLTHRFSAQTPSTAPCFLSPRAQFTSHYSPDLLVPLYSQPLHRACSTSQVSFTLRVQLSSVVNWKPPNERNNITCVVRTSASSVFILRGLYVLETIWHFINGRQSPWTVHPP